MGEFTCMKTTPFKVTIMRYEVVKGTREVSAEGMWCAFMLRPNTDNSILVT